MQAIQETIQAKGWSLVVNIMYISPENLNLIPENKAGDPFNALPDVLDTEFHYYKVAAYIRPDSLEWSFGEKVRGKVRIKNF